MASAIDPHTGPQPQSLTHTRPLTPSPRLVAGVEATQSHRRSLQPLKVCAHASKRARQPRPCNCTHVIVRWACFPPGSRGNGKDGITRKVRPTRRNVSALQVLARDVQAYRGQHAACDVQRATYHMHQYVPLSACSIQRAAWTRSVAYNVQCGAFTRSHRVIFKILEDDHAVHLKIEGPKSCLGHPQRKSRCKRPPSRQAHPLQTGHTG